MNSVEQKDPARPDKKFRQEVGRKTVAPSNGSISNTSSHQHRQEYGMAADGGTPRKMPVPDVNQNLTNPFNTRNNTLKQQKARTRARLFYALLLVLDAALIAVGFGFSYLIRYSLQIGSEVLDANQVPFSEYFNTVVEFTLILIVALHFKGFYNQSRVKTMLDDIGTIFSSTLIAVASMIVLVFISRPLAMSRLMFVYLVPLTVILLGVERGTIRRVRRILWQRGIGVRNLLVVGATDSAVRLMQAVVDKPDLGYNLLGYADSTLRFSEWVIPPHYRNGQEVPQLGDLQNLDELIYQFGVNEIAIALPASHHETINEIIARCRESGVDFSLIPDVFELRVDTLSFTELNGVPLIGLKGNNLRGWNYVLKRAMDILMALLAIIVTLPFMLLIALAVKLDSPGPIIYKQTRIGKNGKPFTFYKFRSMKRNADQEIEELQALNETGGPTFKISNDPRRTRVGKIIRRASLDELPQLFNILIGQMSFVGPRPPIDREVENYQGWHYRRLEVTPGLTGLWQVSGRSRLSFEDMVKLDIYYAENWSLWLDIKILLRTLPAVIRGDGAY